LRPLARRVPARRARVLAEEPTVRRAAECDVWAPVLRPAPARAFEVALVIDGAVTMVPWHEPLRAFRRVLERLGAFSDVRLWWLREGAGGELALAPERRAAGLHRPRELCDPAGRRVVLVASDCAAPMWYDGRARALLDLWGGTQPVALLPVLPQSLWEYTALGAAERVRVQARRRGAPNGELVTAPLTRPARRLVPRREPAAAPGSVAPSGPPVPVVPLRADALAAWARVLTAPGVPAVPAVRLRLAPVPRPGATAVEQLQGPLDRFDRMASPTARELAGCLAAVPLQLPVIRLVQRVALPASDHTHLAEFLLGGLVLAEQKDPADPDAVTFRFRDGVRDALLDRQGLSRTLHVFQLATQWVAERQGSTLDFQAVLENPDGFVPLLSEVDRPFAEIGAQILTRLGGRYAQAAERLSGRGRSGRAAAPPPAAKPEGYQEAERRIAEALRTGATKLDLSGLMLESVPEALGQLVQLRYLNLSNNQLTALPVGLGWLLLLRELYLDNNKITSLFGELEHLTQLQGLYLSSNQLVLLPEGLGQLAQLQELDLSGNHLTALPGDLGRCGQLQDLYLSGNQLTTLPESIGQLTQLQSLYLANNQLASIPSWFSQLAQLRSLYLANNQLTGIPSELGQLVQLRYLDLVNNHLPTLPVALERMTQLRALYLTGNQLAILPEWLARLTQLQALYLASNRLTALPEGLSQLTQLQELYLHNNPALGILPEVLGPTREEVRDSNGAVKPADPKAILAHYFTGRRTDSRPLREAKLLVVGPVGAGKTVLAATLANRPSPLSSSLPTDGVARHQMRTEVVPPGGTEAVPVALNVWDFDGQEITHGTHQFALTERALYLLVLNAFWSEAEAENDLAYWLGAIRDFGGGSPVLVVVNKIESEGSFSIVLDESRLRAEYPNIRGFCRVSGAEGVGVSELRAAISEAVRELPHVFAPVPAAFFAVKREMEGWYRTRSFDTLAGRITNREPSWAGTKSFAALSEYRTVCAGHGLTDPAAQDRLLRLLHDLGAVLHFGAPGAPDELSATVVLDEKWAADAVHQLLDSRAPRERNGVLDRADVAGVLTDRAGFPESVHGFVLALMCKFELCYELAGSSGERFLVPELLPRAEPNVGWLDEHDPAALSFQMRYDALPPGLIPRFIARMGDHLTPPPGPGPGRWTSPTLWRTGCVLHVGGNRCLVRGSVEERRVYVQVQGPEETRREALGLIRDRFGEIHRSAQDARADEFVPVPGRPGVVVAYASLVLNAQNGIERLIPEGNSKPIDIEGLLTRADDEVRSFEYLGRYGPSTRIRLVGGRGGAPPEPVSVPPDAPAAGVPQAERAAQDDLAAAVTKARAELKRATLAEWERVETAEMIEKIQHEVKQTDAERRARVTRWLDQLAAVCEPAAAALRAAQAVVAAIGK
ncbi:SAV_2336 N-terminal domain-related protein, partial [Gemmata sp. JC717]|uniref:SAV_2336 N-terminal domain-related protein n=1 Tax=Gemmata algarum TaxID=2975278 RepID=UPI0021BB83B9